MQFGEGTPEAKCSEIYDLCRQSGINIFDTAYVYTGGKSEEILGKLIAFLHRWDDNTPLEETFETLAGFKDKTQIRAIGVSNFSAWQVMKAQSVAKTFGLSIHVTQPMYNLIKRQAEVEILPMCASEGIAVTPYSPLGGGLLTGKYSQATTGRLTEDHRYAARYNQDW